MIARNNHPSPSARGPLNGPLHTSPSHRASGRGSHTQPVAVDGKVPPATSSARNGAPAALHHGPGHACPVCAERYRQGRSVESNDASALAAGWSLLILMAGALAVVAWVWVLS